MSENKNIAIQHWLILLLLSLLWGSSFILIKKTLLVIEPFSIACLRIAITSLAFMPYVIYIRKKIDWSDWMKYLLLGLTTTGIPSFCFAFAQKYVSSATTGILNSLTPVLTLLISVLVFKAKFQMSKLMGVVLGFTGAGILVFGSSDGNFAASLTGFLIVFFATICYGFNSNLLKEFFPNQPSLTVSAGAFTLVGIPVILITIFAVDFKTIVSTSAGLQGLAFVSILALVCTLFANIVFYKLVQETTPVFASSVTFLIPLVACLWAIWDGESLNIYHFIAVLFILGALLILRKK